LVEGIEKIIKEKQYYMIPMEGVEVMKPIIIYNISFNKICFIF